MDLVVSLRRLFWVKLVFWCFLVLFVLAVGGALPILLMFPFGMVWMVAGVVIVIFRLRLHYLRLGSSPDKL